MKKIFIAFFISFFFESAVFAADFGAIGGRPANPDPNVAHSDQWFLYTLGPGEAKDDGLIVQNNGDAPVEILLYPADSTPSTDGGFALEQMVESRDFVGAWITLSEDRVKLGPHESKVIPFEITVPNDPSLDVGEHSGGILLQKVGQEESGANPQGGLQLVTRIGVRVYVTVPGNIIKELAVDQFSVGMNGDVYVATLGVKNLGNVSQDMTVVTTVKNGISWLNWFFRKFPLKNERTFQVLRGSSFVSHYEFPRPLFGKLLVESTAVYDEGNKPLAITPVVLSVPPAKSVIILGLLVLALIVFSVALFIVKKHDR